MDTLTDRYVHAVTRRLPHGQRAIVGDQLRSEIGAAVESETARGAETGAAETAVLARMGDPDRRAAEIGGWPGYLIGPAWFFDYRRLMIVVLAAVGPSVFGALVLAQALAGQSFWESMLSSLSVAFSVTVQVAFWITVAFAVIERVARGHPKAAGEGWDVSDLPLIPTARVGLGETIFAVLAYLLFIGLVVWQRNVWVVETAGGEPLPVLNPALWSFWIPWFLLLAGLEMAFALSAYAVGRWTWSLAWVNVALNLAFAVPAVWLIWSGAALSTEFLSAFRAAAPVIDAVITIIPIVIIVVAAFDIVDGFRKASLGRREQSAGAV